MDFMFLTDGQVSNDEKLDIIKKYGIKCDVTDFSILLGGHVDSNDYICTSKLNEDCNDLCLSKTSHCHDISIKEDKNRFYLDYVTSSYVLARPALPCSLVHSFYSNGVRGENGILEVEYGEYPQTVVSKDFSDILESAYKDRAISKTGKKYIAESVGYNNFNNSKVYFEYEYNNSKYIRFVNDSNCSGAVLHDGRTIRKGEVYWIRVEPIKWLIDENVNIGLSKKIIFSGVKFNREPIYHENFDVSVFWGICCAENIKDDRLIYIIKKINELENNAHVNSDLQSFFYRNVEFGLFDELNKNDDKKDSFISCMNIVFDSDSYYEMNSKLKLLKKAISTYEKGNKKYAFKLIKEIDSDKHKEVFNGKVVAYPKGSINRVEKPKRIIDRMKCLYSRIDENFDVEVLDSIHEDASSLTDLCNKINYYRLSKKFKRKVKSLFVK